MSDLDTKHEGGGQRMTGSVTLVLGGARSGKSAVAERLCMRHPGPVTYVATMEIGDDENLAARVAAHRARRPAGWTTEEPGPDLLEALRRVEGTVLLDSLGPWLAAQGDGADWAGLCAVLRTRAGHTVVVSDEVGLGVHPSSEAGRQFRDRLGAVNQAVAALSDEVLLVVAGMVTRLQPLGEG